VVEDHNKNKLKRQINDKLKDLRQYIEKKLDSQLSVKLVPSDFKTLLLKDKYPGGEGTDNWIWRPVVFKIYRKRNRQ